MNAPRRKGYTWHGRTVLQRFEDKIEKTDGCWLWRGAVNANGYGSFVTGNKSQTASRVAYELFVAPIAIGQFVLHRCDNPLCVRPEHLFLGTHQDNMRDRNAKGRATGQPGESNPRAKLTAAAVQAIRASDLPNRVLAGIYHVDPNTIRRARKGLMWSKA